MMKIGTAPPGTDKKFSSLCRTILAVLLLSIWAIPDSYAQQRLRSNTLHIKLDRAAADQVALQKDGPIVRSGLFQLDALHEQYRVTRMKRVFRPAGRFEERHRKWGLHQWYEVEYATEASPEVVASAFESAGQVRIAAPVTKKVLHGRPVDPPAQNAQAFVPNDPEYATQWHYNNTGSTGEPPTTADADINLPEAHDINTGSSEVIVSIVDSGLDLDHPEFEGMLWINDAEDINGNGVFDRTPASEGGDLDGIDNDNNGFVDDVVGYDHADDDPIPDVADPSLLDDSHGTHVAGTVAAKNNNGLYGAGVAGGDGTAGSGARLMINQTFASNVGGFAEAIVYAADMGAVVSQNSWGSQTPGVSDPAVLEAIDYLRANAGGPSAPMDGGIFVNSAGNSDSDAEYYPGFYGPSFTVSSTEDTDSKSSFSNYGSHVDIAAPGGEFGADGIWSTVHRDQGAFASFSGTSMAAPHVAGAIAVVVSEYPGLTNDAVESLLEVTGKDISALNPGFQLGNRMDLFAALQEGPDETPPGTITDLSIVAPNQSGASITLQWTAPGDDGTTGGPATAYELRYSTIGPIASENAFENATAVQGVPAPEAPGTSESFTFEGLPFGETVHVALRAVDEAGNTGGLSNSPSATTPVAPTVDVSPSELDGTTDSGTTTTVSLNISNTGPAGSQLNYSFPSFAAEALLARPDVQRNNTTRLGIATTHEKGRDVHAGAGHPVRLGAGGPDDFGYTWIDSNEPGGPAFEWTDISTDGTAIGLTDDFGNTPSAEVSLPFNFTLYGETQSSVFVNNNGMLFFDGDVTSGSYYSNEELPTGAAPNGVIAPFWDDLNPDAAGAEVYTDYDASNNRFIIQWDAVPRFSFSGSPPPMTFQVILYENGLIRFQYQDVNAATTNLGTVGIENLAGDDGLQAAFNTDYIEDGLAVDFSFVPDFIADVSPASGSLAGGQLTSAAVTLTGEGIPAGTYTKDLVLTSNDPNASSTNIPTTLTVNATPPQLVVNPTSLSFGAFLPGEQSTQTLTLTNTGGSDLTISSLSSDNTDFAPSTTGPITIPLTESKQVDVTFAPSSAGSITGALTIDSDDPDGPVTVALEGEGIDPPVVGTSPTSFDETLDFEETTEQTLTVSNTGGSDLNFQAFFVEDGSSTTAEQVAASAPEGVSGRASRDALTAAYESGSRSTTVAPEDASTAVYQLDDGTAENALGLTGGGDVMWMNAFQAVDGSATITSIASAWGAGTGGGVPEGQPAQFLLYDDPNNDGDPSDATLLTSVGTSVTAPHTNTFTEEYIPPTEVEGVFFIAALYRNHADGVNPAPLDETTPQGASWIVGSDPGAFDISDLTNNSVPPGNLDDLGFPGNWVLRADATNGLVTVAPFDGTVPQSGNQDLTVSFDATGISPGDYNGAINVVSNDYDQSPLEVPVSVTVNSAPPAIALDPTSLDFGSMMVGQSATLSVNVSNTGGSPLEVTSIASDNADFALANTDDESFTLGFGESRDVEVTFTPSAAETITGTLTIESNADNTPSVTVSLQGEGLGAPVAGVSPSSFEETIDLGASFDRTMTVSNTGGSDLDFQAIFIEDGSGVAPTAVAAPAPSTVTTDGSSDALQVQPAPNASDVQPFEASTAVYQLDDESSETALGLDGSDIMWMNAFQTVEGAATVTTIASAWGVNGGSGVPASRPAAFFLYEDPNDDGDPSDAVLLQRVETTVQAPHTDTFTEEQLIPTEVSGVFFIAALYQNNETDVFPAPVDTNTPQGASWAVLSTTGGAFDADDLSANDIPPAPISTVSNVDGNWLLRADASSGIVAVSPNEGTVTPDGNGSQDLTVAFDATDIAPGDYNGVISVTSNDPVNGLLEVPVTVTVDGGPPQIAVDPTSLSFSSLVVGQSATLSVTVSNTGGDPLEVTSIASDNADFALANTDDESFTLGFGESRDVEVTFAPSAAETITGTLTIESNADNTPTATVSLQGDGLEPPSISTSPTELSATQTTGEPVDVTLTVSNTGDPASTLDYSFPAFAAEAILSQPDVTPNNTSPLDVDFSHEKGKDPHAGIGHPVRLGAGGPDSFGYYWIDSNEPGGPLFDWTDISSDGTALGLGDDDSQMVTLPFTFTFYGNPNTDIYVGSNGFLSFSGTNADAFSNTGIPNAEAPNGIIAPFWDDLSPNAVGAEVYTYHDAGNNRFIVQWNDVPRFGTSIPMTFQAILYEDGRIRFQYQDVEAATTNSATVGIESPAGDDGVQVALNAPYIENGLAVELDDMPPFITAVTPTSGAVAGGANEEVTVTFDSNGLMPGTYSDALVVSSNDPATPQQVVPATFTVEPVTQTMDMADGWNMRAVPVQMDDMSFGTVLPMCGSGFEFAPGQGYSLLKADDDLIAGRGAFFNCTAGSEAIEGIPATAEIPVDAGWNLIGALHQPVDVSAITTQPAGIVETSFFGFTPSTGYAAATTLEPTYAYWVKVTEAGTLTLTSNAPTTAPVALQAAKSFEATSGPLQDALRVTLTDADGRTRTLYFDDGLSENAPKQFLLPPKPPTGIFDIRFESGGIAEQLETADAGAEALRPVELQGVTFPVTVRLEGATEEQMIQLQDARGTVDVRLSAEQTTAQLTDATSALRVGPAARPDAFALEASYPNPASNRATIEYALPEETHVSIAVYDLLGRRILNAVDERQRAGMHTVTLDAAQLPSGTYFYRMNAGDFTATKRLTIVR